MFPLLSTSDSALNPEDYVQSLASRIIQLQVDAYSHAAKVKQLKLTSVSQHHPPLPQFQLGNLVWFYQSRVGGRAHKFNSLWVGPFEVTFCQGSEYLIKELSSSCPLACVYARFLKLFSPPVSNLGEGSVGFLPIAKGLINHSGVNALS